MGQIKFACARVVCNRFPIDDTCCIPEIFAIKSRSRAKFDVFGPPNFEEKGPPKFLTEFYKSGSPTTMWQKFGDNRPSDLEDWASKKERKKKEKKI